jgi:hypothetical protein
MEKTPALLVYGDTLIGPQSGKRVMLRWMRSNNGVMYEAAHENARESAAPVAAENG